MIRYTPLAPMPDLEVHFSEGQKKRRRRKRFLVIAGIFGVIYLFVFAVLLIFTRYPIFKVREIKILGNITVSEEAVRDLYKMAIGRSNAFVRWNGMRNIVFAPSELPADLLKFIPAIRSTHVEKSLRTRSVEIVIGERTPFGIWCLSPRMNADDTRIDADNGRAQMTANSTSTQINPGTISLNQHFDPRLRPASDGQVRESASDECWWFDIEGVLFKRGVRASGNIIPSVQDASGRVLALNGVVLEADHFKNFLSILKILNSAGLSLKSVSLVSASADELRVETYDDPALYFSLRFPPEGTLAVIENLQAKPDFQKLQYIDFRVEKRTYYR